VRILDLFCGAGGAAMGYHRAFPDAEIVGVDINPQPRYPFTFVQADAMTFDLRGFVFIHASPPCQARTTMSNRHRGKGGKADSHDNYIAGIRWRLTMAGVPYVIENVPGAKSDLHHPVTLSGGMFGLGVDRPRLFECSFPVSIPPRVRVADPIGVYGKAHDGRRLFTRKDGSNQYAASSLAQAREAMGIDWMQWRELAESIPPAYTEHIGQALAAHLQEAEAA
jgi:DNA (cytosine-5)-methyltransferase 1